MTRFIFPFLLSFLCLYAYGQRTGKSLSDYVDAAKQYSPLLHDYRHQLQIEQAELRRLKTLYTRSRLELNGDYLFVPVLTKDGGRVGRLCHRPAHPSQADDRHRCHPCPDAPRLGAQPLAVAVIGGFVAGLPLLLVVLPALMRRIYR